jgi:hypothetical protein
MHYKILENFLNKEFCESLINDANTFSKNDHISVLNNRLILPSSSLSFLNLLKKSPSWKKLHTRLNSQIFLDTLLNQLNLKKKDFTVTNFFFNEKPNILQKKYKHLNSKSISTIGNINLAFYIFYKFYRFFIRKIKYTFSIKNYVELLYDFSKSPNGYKREIHRDSDSRTIVFLIYLNELNNSGSGGDLKLHHYKNLNVMVPSQPKESECDTVKTIPPKIGRLVTFLNSYDSLHSVSEMKDYDGYRYFLYGSFTLLGKKNNFVKNSISNLKTNFNIFE